MGLTLVFDRGDFYRAAKDDAAEIHAATRPVKTSGSVAVDVSAAYTGEHTDMEDLLIGGRRERQGLGRRRRRGVGGPPYL